MHRSTLPPSIIPSDDLHGGHDHQKSGRSALFAQLMFVLLAMGLLVFFRDRAQFHTLGIIFVSIVLEAFPFMLIGTLIGGMIEVFVPREKITKWLPERRWVTVFIAAGLGIVFPVCECAVVPVVRRLLQKGVPLSAAIAFLLGGPIVNPVVAASTAVAYFFDESIVVQRLLFGYIVAVAIGLLVDVIFTKERALRPEVFAHPQPADPPTALHRGAQVTVVAKISQAADHAADDFFDIGRFLVIGAFLAGAAQTMVPRQIFVFVMGSPVLSILIMMGLAMVLNLCSEADAFVAASFRSTPVPLSAQMAFMILGPMLDIKLLLMYVKVFRARTIGVLASLTLVMVFLLMLFKQIAIP